MSTSTSGSAAAKRVSFIEVRPRETERERVEVVLRSGRVLRCAEEIASTALRQLMSVLEQEPTC
jgi:hypothetical protein